MKLSNWGVNAETASTLEVTEREINNMHSRQTREFPYVRHIPEPQPIHQRKFRPSAAKPTVVSVVLPTYQQPQSLDELMHSHLNNIWRSLEHRLEVAKSNGDTNLVRLLEAESKQMMLTLP